jgi:hypothetical protein
MAANKILNCPDAYLSTLSLTTMGFNLLNSTVTTLTPGGVGFTGTQPYIILKHLRITNNLATSAVSCTLYKSSILSSVGNSIFAFSSVSVPANSYLDWYGQARFDTADYLSGIASLAQSVIINMDGEIGLS